MKKVNFFFAAGMLLLQQGFAAEMILSGTLTSDTYLTSDHCYYLQGCVTVPEGARLSIAAGTEIKGLPGSGLIVQRGATIEALGTAAQPVVFTSAQPAGTRQPGDWAGIVINGYAVNNVVHGGGGDIQVTRCGISYSGGGTDDASSAGILRYVRIEYAGGDAGAPGFRQALLLNSLGSNTEIHHIQTYASDGDAFRILGGTVNARYLVSYNARGADFHMDMGYRGKMQFGLALKPAVVPLPAAPFSNGMIIGNNSSDTDNNPYSHPLISNFTILGPGYCDPDQPLPSDFRYALLADHNARFDIANSIFAGFGSAQFFIADVASAGNTGMDLLNFRYNMLIPGSAPAYGSASWGSGACGPNMGGWIGNAALFPPCKEPGNEIFAEVPDLPAGLCTNFCSMTPSFGYAGQDLEGTDFSGALQDLFFEQTVSKGALLAQDWTAAWTAWCQEQAGYCTLSASESGSSGALRFIPNPGRQQVAATFYADIKGKALLEVSDKISGKILLTASAEVEHTGMQQILFSAERLKEGVYPVTVTTNQRIYHGQLVVR